MNFKLKTGRAWIVMGIMMGLLTTTPVTASIVGSMSLDITNGIFSSDATGSSASGNFVFRDTLLSAHGGTTAGLASQPYSYSGLVEMQAGASPGALNPFADASRNWANWAALSSDPIMQLGLSLFSQIVSNPDGEQSFDFDFTPLPGGQTFTLNWELTFDDTSDATHATGNFVASSEQGLDWLSQILFSRDLPADAYFAGGVILNAHTTAISEPMSLALFGIGILGLGALRGCRRIFQV